MYCSILVASLLATSASSYYVPESGSDWSLLKPQVRSPKGSHDSVAFNFGIVVNPYKVDSSGSYVEPEIDTVVPQTKTVVKTHTVLSVAMPTKTADVVQIMDGQVQRVLDDEENECTDDESDLEKRSFDNDCTDEDEPEDENDCGSGNDDDDADDDANYAVSCATNSTLLMTLENGILRDTQNRIGSIVGSHQFQFDGPTPQYGTIYAAGWLITREGQLCLGNSTLFYQCSSGDFYNLYDFPIAPQCSPVSLDVVELIEC